MFRVDTAKVAEGVIVQLDFNPPKKKDESDEAAEKRFAGKQQWAKLSFQDVNANKRYGRRIDALVKPFRRQVQLGTLSDEKNEELGLQAFLELILIDWGNIPIPGAIPFSFEGARRILSDPEWSLFYAELRERAADAQLFSKVELDDDTKN